MSIIRAMREESETIKFDNLFTNDLEQEQEFDLIFTAEQDDEDIKSIAGNQIMKENGEEIPTNLPDCIAVNEEGEVVDKDDEAEEDKEGEEPVEDIGGGEKVAAAAAPAQAPSVVVNVDADDVNINAADPGVDASVSESESEAEHNNVGMTINANTVNMSVGANTPDNAPTPTVEPAAVPAPAEEPAEDNSGNIEPIGDEEEIIDIEDNDNNGVDDSVDQAVADAEEETDNAEEELQSDEDGEPTATAEAGMEDIYTASQLEDILNTGLEPAPAPQTTTPENEPVDPSTEVKFSDTGDIEVQEAGEPTIEPLKEEDGEIEDLEDDDLTSDEAPTDEGCKKEACKEAELTAVKNDITLAPAKKIEAEFEDDLKTVTDVDVEKVLNKAPEDEVKEELGIKPVEPKDLPMNDGSVQEAGEPTIEPLKEEDGEIDDLCDPTEGCPVVNDGDIPQADGPKHRDTSELSAIAGKNTDEVQDAAETVEELELNGGKVSEAAEDMDPQEATNNQDAEDALLSIEPSLTAGDLGALFNDMDDDSAKKNDGKLSEAGEPTIEPLKEENGVIDDADPIDAADISKDTEFSPIDPVEVIPDEVNAPYEDINYDDAAKEKTRVAEAGEPTIEPLKEEDGKLDFEDNLEDSVEDKKEVENTMQKASEDEVKDELGIDPVEPSDIPGGPVKEAGEPTIEPLKEELDFDDAVNAMDNGDAFADVVNTGLNTTPEEVEPGSIDELIDDEIIDIVESDS